MPNGEEMCTLYSSDLHLMATNLNCVVHEQFSMERNNNQNMHNIAALHCIDEVNLETLETVARKARLSK